MDLIDITKPAGRSNTAGMSPTFYAGRKSDVKTWPTKEAVPTTPGDNLIYTTPVVMNTGKKMIKLEFELGNAEIKHTLIGGRGGKCYKNTLEVFLPSLDPEVLGFAAETKNDDLFFIGRDRTGKLRFIGSELLPCVQDTGDGTTGKKAEDDPGAGTTLMWSTEDDFPPIIYDAEIPLTPAV